MAETRFSFKMEGIAALLESRRLAVPVYQRSYAWGEERDHVKEFFTDLRDTFVEAGAEYFLGTTVFTAEGIPDRHSVIDGQQRLATTAILVAAIRDEFKARGDTARQDIIESTFLSKSDLRSAEKVPQLVLNAEDDPFFREYVVKGNVGVEPTRASHQLIKDAYVTLRGYITATANDAAGAWSERLLDWTEFLRDRVKVIAVEVPTEADAFLIFETLNDRGADLTISDLLKNYLFGRSGDQIETLKSSWTTSFANLDIANVGNQFFTDFLRHYWSSKYGTTRERELYGEIKGRISTAQNAVDFGEELRKASRLYAALLNSDHDFWSPMGSPAKDLVEGLNILSLQQVRPLLLALVQHFEGANLLSALKSVVAWGVRGLVVGGIGGGVNEKAYCEAAIAVRAGDIKDVSALKANLSNVLPSDIAFEEGVVATRISRGAFARYMLRALERKQIGDTEPELVPNTNEQEVNLEHILPKNATEVDWPTFTPEQKAAYLDRLGNLALLQKGPNGRIGNKPFSDKKPVLSSSAFQLTSSAGAVATWDPTAVTDRSKALAKLAVLTWPL